MKKRQSRLLAKTRYLQIALNSTLSDAAYIISSLPVSERILIEAGTPLIKRYGTQAITQLRQSWELRLMQEMPSFYPYIIADLKCMDRAEHEVSMAKMAGADAAVVLGLAPVETLNAFVHTCEDQEVDAFIDMMNVEMPYQILRRLDRLPTVVLLHRGVDEEALSDKRLPIHMINKIKGAFDVMIGIAGGDTPREIQSAVFNGAEIVVLWKNFYTVTNEARHLAEEFLHTIK